MPVVTMSSSMLLIAMFYGSNITKYLASVVHAMLNAGFMKHKYTNTQIPSQLPLSQFSRTMTLL